MTIFLKITVSLIQTRSDCKKTSLFSAIQHRFTLNVLLFSFNLCAFDHIYMYFAQYIYYIIIITLGHFLIELIPRTSNTALQNLPN